MIPSRVTLLLLAVGLVTSSSADSIIAQGPVTIPAPEANTLQVFALPVGQGDCTVVQCPNGNIVVFDCGSSGGNGVSPDYVENWLGNSINNVVAILISHAQRDHYNYLPYIAWNSASINAVIIGGTVQNYRSREAAIRDWIDDYNNQGKVYTIGTVQSSPSSCIGNCIVATGTNFCNNGNFQFNILAANTGTSSTPNQLSPVIKIVASGGWSLLLSGDMEGQASLNIANQLGAGLQSLVYKMSHHGASTQANLNNWLMPIAPQYAFASSGYNYGNCKHPRCDTINRLLALNTITTKTPHRFYCGNAGGAQPTIYTNFQYNMLETSPNSTHICLLTYVSATSIQPQANCFQYLPTATVQSQTADDEAVPDDECGIGVDEDIDGGALPVVVSYFVLATTMLLYFVIQY